MKDLLNNNRLVKISELILIFAIAYGFIKIFLPFAGENMVYKQLVIWIANILMLLYVWIGMKLRGQKLADFGITFGKITIKESFRIFLISIGVFIVTVAAFVFGSIVMANITGIPEGTDMSGYDYLKDNIGMLFLTLGGVYIVSSFGEEVIYRAFLINRISELGQNTKKAVIIAVILSSIIFGLVHYQWGPMGMVQTGFMGLALGICYFKLKRRLWILILAHAYADTLLMVQMYFAIN